MNLYDLVTSSQQINMELEVRNFEIIIEFIKMILNECTNNDILTTIQTVNKS